MELLRKIRKNILPFWTKGEERNEITMLAFHTFKSLLIEEDIQPSTKLKAAQTIWEWAYDKKKSNNPFKQSEIQESKHIHNHDFEQLASTIDQLLKVKDK